MSENIIATITPTSRISVSTFSEGGRTLSELTDIDLQGVTNGSLLIYDTNEFVSRTLSGDATLSASGVITINPNAVTLGADTTGAYVSTVTGTLDQITVIGSGSETANITLSLPQSIATSSSPSFNNITLSGVINNSDLTTKLSTKVDKVVGQGLSDSNYTLTEKNKLAGIADGATANSTDAHLLSRANHTGSQSYTTITGLGTLATQSGTFSGSSSGTNTGDQTITLGGDATGSGTGLVNVTLASTGVPAGEYNSSTTSVTPFTVDIKGRITAVDTPITITPSWNSVTDKPTTLSGYGITDAVDLTSSQTISGHKDFTSSPTVPLIPTAAGHAASKAYVDTLSEGLHVHAAVHAILQTPLATTIGGGVTITYSNGTNGVGAKLTVSAPVTWTTVFNDSDIIVGSRVIIAGQSASAHNGIYVINSSTELMRAEDFNTPTEMAGGDFVFVTHGTYADTGWVLSEPVTEVGASAVIFTQFSGAGAYEAGAGLSRDGTTFSVVAGTGIAVDGSVSLSTVGSPGTYRSVAVDSYGRITSGTNPTTLSGYGITDAATSTALSNHISDATVHLTSTQNTLLDGITVSAEKVNYLTDVTSNIQGQLNVKQPLDSDLTAIAGLTGTSGLLRKTGTDVWTLDTNTYSVSGHTHGTSQITDLYQPSPHQDPDATSAIMMRGYKLDLVGPRTYIYYESGEPYLTCVYSISINRWILFDSEVTLSTSTSDGLYPWLATWPGGSEYFSATKYSYPRVAGAPLASTASDGVSNYSARADHVHPFPTALQVGAAPLVGGKVPIQYMPNEADDVLVFYDRSDFPATGQSGKIYLAQNDRRVNGVWYEGGRMYYWGDNSSYTEIAPLSVYNPSDADALVAWSSAANSVFVPNGIVNNRLSYTLNQTYYMQYDVDRWIIYSIGEELYLEAQAAPGTEAYPWLANWGTPNYITRVGFYSYDQSSIPRKGASIGSSGTSGRSARADHVHPLPTAAEIGAASLDDSSTIIGLSIFL
jgi:hypothetical protein